jgi:hypothetical protein
VNHGKWILGGEMGEREGREGGWEEKEQTGKDGEEK